MLTGIIESMERIRYSTLLLYLMVVAAILCPGLLIFYLYKPELFLGLGTAKLLLLSMAISLPIPMWNSLMYVFIFNIDPDRYSELNQEQKAFILASSSCLISLGLFFFVIYVFYWFNLPLRNLIHTMAWIEIVLTVLIYYRFKNDQKKKMTLPMQ